MKVNTLSIKNFKGITEQEIKANGCHVFLSASNGKGKTSIMDALWSGLNAKKMPAEPVKKGSKKAVVKVDIGEYIAEIEVIAKTGKQKFTLKTSDGKPVTAAPKTVLNQCVGMIDFDPLDFFNLSEKKRVEYLCNIIGGPIKDDIDNIDIEYEEAFESRKYDKKKLAELQAQAGPYDKTLVHAEPLKAEELSKKMQAATEHNVTYNRTVIGVEHCRSQITEIETEIADLERKKLEFIKNKTLGKLWLEENSRIDIDDITVQLNSIEEENNKIRIANHLHEIEQQVEKTAKSVEEVDSHLAGLLEMKSNMLSGLIDIDGLTYDGEQFLYNDLPFQANQINQADIIIAGLSIGATMLKGVRILRFDGSLLDNSNIAKVTEWADKNNIQLWAEFVSRDESDLVVEIQEA